MASSENVRVLEHCRIAPPPPPPSSVDEKSLPLTFFDMPWLYFPYMKLLYFYEFSQYSKPYFVGTIVPRLKHSLSLTLKHYFPLSGNLIFRSDRSMPEIRFMDGDSISLTFAECSSDFRFDHLIGNHQRNDTDFHPFAAEISPTSINSDPLVVPLLSIRVTLFPNSGICIGLTHHHIVGDANAIFRFVRSWASINKLGGDATLVESRILPFYDRTVVNDPIGLRSTFWNHFEKMKSEGLGRPPPIYPNTVLATFILSRAEVERLKKRLIPRAPKLSHVSAFMVICGYVWSCIVKARAVSDEDDGEGESEHLAFSADCRKLLDPPIPAAYFGNCIIGVIVTTKSLRLIQETGFTVAANLIGEAIQERVLSKGGILGATQKWVSDSKSVNRSRLVAVIGSPRFDVYGMDFGLGRPKKFEVVSPRGVDSFSLNGCKDDEEDFEVGLHLQKAKMDAFVEIFTKGLKAHSSL